MVSLPIDVVRGRQLERALRLGEPAARISPGARACRRFRSSTGSVTGAMIRSFRRGSVLLLGGTPIAASSAPAAGPRPLWIVRADQEARKSAKAPEPGQECGFPDPAVTRSGPRGCDMTMTGA